MHTPARYILAICLFVISLHFILGIAHEPYGRATSLSQFAGKVSSSPSEASNDTTSGPKGQGLAFSVETPNFSTLPEMQTHNSTQFQSYKRANATFVILCRNSDLHGTIQSIREIEDRFNGRYGYPYVLLNEEEFTEEFKRRVSVLTTASISFGLIPRDHWYQPNWIDEAKAKESRDNMVEKNIIYGGSVSYRNMCRFNSGFFFKHPSLQPYRWYWRIEPDVHFHCDIHYDPFRFMEENNKVYSFTIAMYEYEATIPTLWGHVKDFIKMHPEYVAEDNAMGFMSGNGGDSYNLCHFWSNFEIADMDFWRAPAYTAFFEYLDEKGGFYYERWGDAPVHSIAAALFASRDQIQFFDDIGYEHNPYTHCPRGKGAWERGRCTCDPAKNFDYNGYSCMRQWDALTGN